MPQGGDSISAEAIAAVLGIMGAMVLVVHAVEIVEKRGKRRAVVFYLIALVVWAAIDYLFVLPQLRASSPAYAENGEDYSLLYGHGIFQRDNVVMACNHAGDDSRLWTVARAYDVQSGRYLTAIDPSAGDKCRTDRDEQGRNYDWYQAGTIEPYDPTASDAWNLQSTAEWGDKVYR